MEPTPEEEHRLANVGWGEILVLASVGMRALEENPARLKDAGVQEGARELARALGARCPESFAGDIDLNDVADLVKDVDIDMDETWKEARKGQARGQWRDYREERWTAHTEREDQKWRHSYEPGDPYGQRGWHGARYGWQEQTVRELDGAPVVSGDTPYPRVTTEGGHRSMGRIGTGLVED